MVWKAYSQAQSFRQFNDLNETDCRVKQWQPSAEKGVFRSKLDSIYDDEDWNAKDDMIDDSELYLAAPDPSGMEMATANKIDELEAKRDDSRRQIEAIKRSLKL